MNPTQNVFEARITQLEGGVGALATLQVKSLLHWHYLILWKLVQKL